MAGGLSAGDALLEARILDAVRLCEKTYQPRFAGFLDEREAGIAQRAARREGFSRFLLWGGHENAERVMFGAFPDYYGDPEPSEFPLCAVTVRYRACDSLTHRDFLGSFLAAGITRASLGDILVGEGRSVVFVREEIADFLLGQISKIGRVGVKLSRGAEEPLPQGRGFQHISAVIASSRLDCAVAACCGLSREKAASLINSGAVLLCHEEILSASAPVAEGDKLSVRGKGRYVVDRVGPPTKKGRLSFQARKYL